MARVVVALLLACGLACATCMSLEVDDSVSAVQIFSAVLSSAVDFPEDPTSPGTPEMGTEGELEMDEHQTEPAYCSQGAGTEPWESWTSRKKQFCCRTQGLRCLETLLYMHNCFSATAKWTPSRREWCCQHRGMSCNETETKQLELEAFGPRGWPYDCREKLQAWDAWEPEHKRWCCMVDGLKCDLLEGEIARSITDGLVAPQSGRTDQKGATEFDCRVGVKAQDGWSQEKKAWCWGCKTGLERWSAWDPYKKDFCCRSEGVACREAERYIHNCRSDASDYKAWSPEKKLWCCRYKGEKCLQSNLKVEEWGPRQFPYDCRDNVSWGSWAFMQQKWCCKVEGLRCTEVQHFEQDRGFGLDAAAQPAAFEVPGKNAARSEARMVVEGHAEQTSANAEQAGKPDTDAHPSDEVVKRLEDHQTIPASEKPVEQNSAPQPVEGVSAPEGHTEQSGAQQTEKPSEYAAAEKPVERLRAPRPVEGASAPDGHTEQSDAQQTEKLSEHGGVAAEESAQQSST